MQPSNRINNIEIMEFLLWHQGARFNQERDPVLKILYLKENLLKNISNGTFAKQYLRIFNKYV